MTYFIITTFAAGVAVVIISLGLPFSAILLYDYLKNRYPNVEVEFFGIPCFVLGYCGMFFGAYVGDQIILHFNH